MTTTENTTAQPAHLLITGDDTVSVAGERGSWIVGAVRPVAEFSHLAEHQAIHLLVTRVTGGRREVSATSMWVRHDRVRLVRKGNADADAMIALLGEDPTAHKLPYGLATTVGGWSANRVVAL